MLDLITDRTQADVDRWEYLRSQNWDSMTDIERTEWSNGTKGSYGATDLNRVGEAVEYIAKQFQTAGYDLELKPIRTDWTINDKPSMTDLKNYLENVSTLKDMVANLPGTPETPEDMSCLTYEEANAIEQILFDVDIVLQKLLEGTWYSNSFMFYSGNIPLPSNLAEYVLADNAGVILVSNDNCIFIAR